MGVDIIIPIYNAFEDLQVCLQSLYKNTNLGSNRLILINDNSPDERIRPCLDEQADRNRNVIVVHNEKNKGFSANVNIGIAQSRTNDVILLNSDTIVTENWVEKIVECAYSDDEIGTVTPMSNNATLCSVPVFGEENSLPQQLTVERAAKIAEECSMKKYPRITVANGFCMFIKREVIECIGGFDAETFGRGYGEENDFCNRAEQMGYIHVMCDDTYIYHSGTKSFVSKEKEAYQKEHEQILRNRYPAQMHKNDVFCQNSPNSWAGNNLALYFDIWNGKKNILYLLQSDFKQGANDNIGGTQFHVRQLVQELRETVNVFVAARDGEYLQVTAYIEDREHTFRFFAGEAELFPMPGNRRISRIVDNVLTGFHIDLVHVHHTATTSLDIYYQAKKRNIPILYTVHDYYYVCPNTTLLDGGGKVCADKQKPDCTKCLALKKGIYDKNEYLNMWRAKHNEILGFCKQIIVPSESTKEIFGKYYPEQSNKIRVIEHGMNELNELQVNEDKIIYTDEFEWALEKVITNTQCPVVMGKAYLKKEPDAIYKVILKISDVQGKTIFWPTNFGGNRDLLKTGNGFSAHLPNRVLCNGDLKISAILCKDDRYYSRRGKEAVIKNVNFSSEKGLRVAFVGGINDEKGGKAVTEIIRRGNNKIEWYVIGGIGEENLAHLQKRNLVKTGYYHQEDLYTYLKGYQIDVVCILSKCPETFSYTLSEAVLSHIPVIATDVGALGHRVRTMGCGALVNAEDDNGIAEEVTRQLCLWMEREEEYQKILKEMKICALPSVKEMGLEYQKLYEACYENVVKEKPSRDCMEQLYHAYMHGQNGYQGDQSLITRINELENRLKIIDNSITFKIVLKLTGMRFPFKQKIRSWLRK